MIDMLAKCRSKRAEQCALFSSDSQTLLSFIKTIKCFLISSNNSTTVVIQSSTFTEHLTQMRSCYTLEIWRSGNDKWRVIISANGWEMVIDKHDISNVNAVVLIQIRL